ncbi:MAG: hypothetical protein MJ236_05895 [Clostridia bacterium]|nr:hypothetical protein [Clostridia bacterium]
MLGAILILGFSHKDAELLKGSFGIYYKIAQFALFACFGMSNGIITIMSYNYGQHHEKRCKDCLKYGLIMTLIVTGVITVIFEALAGPIAFLFSLAGGSDTTAVTDVVVFALRIGALSFMFMGVTISIQGMLQAFRYSVYPLILSLLRLIVIVFPVLYLFTLTSNPTKAIWFALPITEAITMVVAIFMIRKAFKEKIAQMDIEIEQIKEEKEEKELEAQKKKLEASKESVEQTQ